MVHWWVLVLNWEKVLFYFLSVFLKSEKIPDPLYVGKGPSPSPVHD
jgi:hypothetical protein